ncbi:unnamed protein product [Rhizoctonia solani]|uniref:Uncharacterized protein n=1 Tax=Rhizoctonia solani TaxID=456999 RepID=A0A8H3HL60_9AGAM|nr:unnamed protein product [Rhizoctonia solani]
MGSPAERFRNELSWRLCTEGHISLPSANILLGVIIDGMEYNLGIQHRPIAQTTLRNVLKVSREIECLARILDLRVRTKYKSVEVIPSLTLHTLRTLSLQPTALLNPDLKTITYVTYTAVVHRLSASIGPQAVHDLIKDFNSTIPKKIKGRVRKVPGVGPRVVKRNEGAGPVRNAKLALRIRDREKPLAPSRTPSTRSQGRSSTEQARPTRSMERPTLHNTLTPSRTPSTRSQGRSSSEQIKPKRSMERPMLQTNNSAPHSRDVRNKPRAPPVAFRPPREPGQIEEPQRSPSVRPLRAMRSAETFSPSPAPASPISRSHSTRSKASPYLHRRASEPVAPNPEVQTPGSPTTWSFKRRSLRGFEYLRHKLGRISRIYSSESSA